MRETSTCFFCGERLVSGKGLLSCMYCGQEEVDNDICPDGHYICRNCRGKNIIELIEDFCLGSNSQDPVNLAIQLMKAPHFKMHCPEHHFLVPAVLLTAYSNTISAERKLDKWLLAARFRAEKVPGAFCGTHGICGAAIGTGIFISLLTRATPLSGNEWELSNSQVGRSLLSMASYGGPRCCKRVTFISLLESGKFLKEKLGVQLNIPEIITCTFSEENKQECLKEKCPFYPANVLS
ncbi:MAG: DUF5714 domain-containing protein [Mariniphaga sp.]|nr:DUF5714 domain-containing protein [Mariniphaga sp.]